MPLGKSGDDWLNGPDGETVWGLYGAAGLLLSSAGHVLLQHRALWTAHGNTWGIPGGARDEHETAEATALREAAEETGLSDEPINILFESKFDLGWWSYTTIVATTDEMFEPVSDAESIDVQWVSFDDVGNLDLHPSFGNAWPKLHKQLLESLNPSQ